MTESKIVYRTQLQRVIVVGNSGFGKSSLAQRIAGVLEAPAIDLDQIHWQGDTYGSRQGESIAEQLVAEAASKQAWVIEGVFGWLARIALPRATAFIWLDISWEDCRAGLMVHGLRRGMTNTDHAALVAWAAEYWARDTPTSYRGHLRLFEGFSGPKLRFRNRSQIDQFVSAVVLG